MALDARAQRAEKYVSQVRTGVVDDLESAGIPIRQPRPDLPQAKSPDPR